MPTNNKMPPLLTEANAAFLPYRTSMNVAARDAQNRPAVARALGCRVSPDRRRVTVFLSTTHSALVLERLRENGAIALAVTRPATHEALQLKGTVLEITPLSAEDRAALVAYQDSFVDELSDIGYRAQLTRTIFAGSENCVAVVFAPDALFNQTPGPKAGEKLAAQP